MFPQAAAPSALRGAPWVCGTNLKNFGWRERGPGPLLRLSPMSATLPTPYPNAPSRTLQCPGVPRGVWRRMGAAAGSAVCESPAFPAKGANAEIPANNMHFYVRGVWNYAVATEFRAFRRARGPQAPAHVIPCDLTRSCA